MNKTSMGASHSLIDEIEDAIRSGSKEKRVDTLRRVTDLFLTEANRLSDRQIALFDDVLGHLIERIEIKAMAELSTALAPVNNAPIELNRRLARDDEIAVAGPVLKQSERLSARDLVEITQTKGQAHLLAISSRRELDAVVTDALLDRDNRAVKHTLVKNEGARFSEAGFSTLVKSAETDSNLAEKVGLRLDLPSQLLRELLAKATETVRSRLLTVAPFETREAILRILDEVSNKVVQEVAAPRNFTRALHLVSLMQKNGILDEEALLAFAAGRKYEEVVACVATLCSTSVNLIVPLMKSVRNDGLLIACKAAALKWSTLEKILEVRSAVHGHADSDFSEAKTAYQKLSRATAQRTLRFWQIRQGARKEVGPSSSRPGFPRL